MAEERAQRTIGALLKKLGTSPFDVGHLTNIGSITIESEEIDVTTLSSPDDFMEFIAGFKDAGEVSIEGILKDQVAHEKMLALANSREIVLFELRFANGKGSWWFEAFVKSYGEADVETKGVRGFTGALRITGAPEYAKDGVSA